MKGWSVVFRGPGYAADTVAASLDAAGIRVETMVDTGHLWPGVNLEDSRVFVPEEEAAQARRLIDSEFPEKSSGTS
ncbi:MAG TPA: hypothetical protein VNG93_01455 [Candidatus Dormibacteraeota bacterium]|nr:hypothetical protein [Candidatus Dormibacteraeota bacterium]